MRKRLDLMKPKYTFLLTLPLGLAIGIYFGSALEDTTWWTPLTMMIVVSLFAAYINWLSFYDHLCWNQTMFPPNFKAFIHVPTMIMSIGGTFSGAFFFAVIRYSGPFEDLLVMALIAIVVVTFLGIAANLLLGALAVILDVTGYFAPQASETGSPT